MNSRPTSVTVIAWLLIIVGLISAVSTVATINNPMVVDLMRKSPMPISLQYALSAIGLLITLVSGIAMLKGQNWARFLYVMWSAIGFVIGLATSPIKVALIPGMVFLAIIAFFLFSRKANNFFSPTDTSDDAQPV